jgi:phage FluMu protein Com
MTDQDYLDGNAAAGLLSEVFAVDVTAAVGRCAHCGDQAVVARGRVYTDDHGLVLRCNVCGDVLAVASERAGRLCLDMRGLAWLEFPVE